LLKVIDSHVHFWQPEWLRYAWLDGLPSLNRPYLPDHVPVGGTDWRMEALVFIQAECLAVQGPAEVDWVNSLAANDPRIQAVVAFAPLELGAEVAATLKALNTRPLVRGVRRLIQSEPVGFSVQPGFLAGVRLLAEFNFTCDLCIRHYQMRDVIQLVRECPDVRFVLDHIGKPDIKTGLLEPWRSELAELAAMPNVMCKVSGLVTEADWKNWTAADLQPYIEHTLAAFGPDRVMFGSDAPVAYQAATYARWLETLRAATASLSEADREKLFYRNAATFYRLPQAG
jgi:L-fuconolactonase